MVMASPLTSIIQEHDWYLRQLFKGARVTSAMTTSLVDAPAHGLDHLEYLAGSLCEPETRMDSLGARGEIVPRMTSESFYARRQNDADGLAAGC
jgi:hypothetical protein